MIAGSGPVGRNRRYPVVVRLTYHAEADNLSKKTARGGLEKFRVEEWKTFFVRRGVNNKAGEVAGEGTDHEGFVRDGLGVD